MSRTLFWYVLKDLVRIFVLASVALAAIMSFGGLLRPLTEHGLDVQQVTRILGYFMPAMQTYSLPVAALFATTMVYGKLSADNELIACRAAGIGYWPIWLPAIVLGLYTRFLDHRGLLAGWAVGIVAGTWMAISLQLKGSIFAIHVAGLAIPGYAAIWSLLLNIAVAVVVSIAVRAIGMHHAEDLTRPEDYLDAA